MLRLLYSLAIGGLLCACEAVAAERVNVAPLVTAIKSVGREGAGHREATAAWAKLAEADASQLPEMLVALNGAAPLPANWIRAAIETVAERQLKSKGQLPQAELERFVLDRQHDSRARRLAFEWLARVDATAPDRLIPQMANDPSLELRRDAVARLLAQGDKLNEAKVPGAIPVYRQALVAARDNDQVKAATDQLRNLGESVDLPRHFGFVMEWNLIGPFDNRDKKGYAVANPPEEKIDLTAKYAGKEGEVAWTSFVTSDQYGHVDLNKALSKHMGATVYAYAEFVSDREQPVELRLGCVNANKLWLNGQLVGQAEVYHAAYNLDQYISRGVVKPGRNTILIKVCQNEQTENWAQDWKFQFRVCDATGTAILSQDRPRTPEGAMVAPPKDGKKK